MQLCIWSLTTDESLIFTRLFALLLVTTTHLVKHLAFQLPNASLIAKYFRDKDSDDRYSVSERIQRLNYSELIM